MTWWAHRDTQSVFLNPVQTHAGGTCGKNVLLIHHFDHHFDPHLGPIAITKTPRPIIIGSAIKCNDPRPSLCFAHMSPNLTLSLVMGGASCIRAFRHLTPS